MQGLRKLSTGLVVAGCMAALPAAARADVVLFAQVNGGGIVQLCTSATTTCSGPALLNIGGVVFTTTSITSNAPGTGLVSDVQSVTLAILNTNALAANIRIWAGGSNFSNPTTGLLENKLSGTSIAGTTGSSSLVSCAFVGAISTVAAVPCSGITTGAAAAAISGSFNATTTAPVVAIGTPYSLENILDVTALNAGGSVSFTDATDISAVPEPTSMALMASGLFGLVGFARRRKQS